MWKNALSKSPGTSNPNYIEQDTHKGQRTLIWICVPLGKSPRTSNPNFIEQDTHKGQITLIWICVLFGQETRDKSSLLWLHLGSGKTPCYTSFFFLFYLPWILSWMLFGLDARDKSSLPQWARHSYGSHRLHSSNENMYIFFSFILRY